MNGFPPEWDVRALTDIAEVRLGRQRSPKNHRGSQMRPYLRAANVGWKGLLLDDVNTMNFTDTEMETYRLIAGDILLSEASGSPGEVGKPALWSGELDECGFQNTLIRVRPGESVEPRFLVHYFRHLARAGHFVGHSRGVGIHHIGRGRLANWRTPVPSLLEQKQIVEILEDHLSRLDAADAGLVDSEGRITVLRERLVRDAITGSNVPGRRQGPDLVEAGTRDGDLPTLPVGWVWCRLAEIADVVGGVTKDASKQSDPDFVEVPYLRVANVQRAALRLETVTRIRVAPSKAKALTLEPGDVLMNEGGDRDKLARGWVWEGQVDDCIHQNHVFRARVHLDLDPFFLSWTANTLGASWAGRNAKQSVNLASISLSMIRRMPVIVPPAGESRTIVERLHTQLASLDRVARELESARERGRGLRRAVLVAAFSGKLTGRHTDQEVIEELADV